MVYGRHVKLLVSTVCENTFREESAADVGNLQRDRKSVTPTTTVTFSPPPPPTTTTAPPAARGPPTGSGGARVLPTPGGRRQRQHRFGCVCPPWCCRQFPPIVGPQSRPTRGARCPDTVLFSKQQYCLYIITRKRIWYNHINTVVITIIILTVIGAINWE